MIKYILLIMIYAISLNAFDIVAHRGYVHFPENSNESIKSALEYNYNGVEIDIQPLKKSNGVQSFALIHDLVVKRELKVSFLNSLKPSIFFTKEKWQTFTKKNRYGQPTIYNATTLKQVLEIFNDNFKDKQFLNIEIKSPLVDTTDFYNLIKPYLSKFTIQVSSNYLDKLKEIRDMDKNIYLGYIFLPNSKGVKKTVDKKVNGFLGMMHLDKYKTAYNEKSEKYTKQYEEKVTKGYFRDLKDIESKLSPNMGIHVDFEDVKKYTDLFKDISKNKNIKIYIYSLDHDMLIETIKEYFENNNLKLDGVISDEDIQSILSNADSLKKKIFLL